MTILYNLSIPFRKLRLLIAFFLLLTISKTDAQTNWDTLFMKNGQVVYGEIKSISLGRVNFDAEDLSLMSLKYDKVKTIIATKRYYRIETTSHKEYFGKLKYSDKEGFVNISNIGKNDTILLALSEISTLNYFSTKNNIWEGKISAGYSYTKSSQIGRLNVDFSLKSIMKKGEFRTAGSTIITQDNGAWVRERESLSFNRDIYLNALWKAGVLLNYQRNLELGLARRYQEGVGVGYSFLSKSTMKGDIVSGLIVNQEKSSQNNQNVFTAELPILFNYNFFRFQQPKLSIYANESFYISLTQKGRVRQDGEIKIDWELIKDFSVSLKFYNNYDSKPASTVAGNFDYGIVFGLTYSFD